MSWRQDSSAGAYVWDTAPLSDQEILCRDEEIRWLARHEQKQGKWKLINGRLAERGDLVASRGNYGAPGAYALAQAGTAVAMVGTTNIAWWNPTSYSPIPANSVGPMEAVESATATTFEDSSSINLLEEIRSKHKQWRSWVWVRTFSTQSCDAVADTGLVFIAPTPCIPKV